LLKKDVICIGLECLVIKLADIALQHGDILMVFDEALAWGRPTLVVVVATHTEEGKNVDITYATDDSEIDTLKCFI